MQRLILLATFVALFFSAAAQKKALDHTVYDQWKSLSSSRISNNGSYVFFEIKPAKGDGELHIYNDINNSNTIIPRAYYSSFSYDNEFLVAKIKPYADSIRAEKKAKVKKDDTVKDSLVVLSLTDNYRYTFSNIKSYGIAREGGDSVVAHFFKKKKEKKTTKDEELDEDEKEVGSEETKEKEEIEEKEEKEEKAKEESKEKEKKKPAKKAKTDGTSLFVFYPETNDTVKFSDVTSYKISKDGSDLVLSIQPKDTLKRVKLVSFDTKKRKETIIFDSPGDIKQSAISNTGDKFGFVFSSDTSKVKTYSLYLSVGAKDVVAVVDTLSEGLISDWSVSKNGSVYFSENEEKLFFHTAYKPLAEPKDTLLEEEKCKVDVWSWKDPQLQPQQKLNVSREKNRSFLAVYELENDKLVQLADSALYSVSPQQRGDLNIALGRNNLPYQKYKSWIAADFADYYVVDITSGKKELLIEKSDTWLTMSPNGEHVAWYESKDSCWYAMNIQTKKSVNLTSQLGVAFYDEQQDMPMKSNSYGFVSWADNGKSVILYDKYDIWQLDPKGEAKAKNLTSGYGRENNIVLRYQQTDYEQKFIDTKKDMLLEAFNETNKQSGFYSLVLKKKPILTKLVMDDYSFRFDSKAKDADKYIWRKGSFIEYPELRLSGISFNDDKVLSKTNPQQEEYLWGTSELVDWVSFDNAKLQGILCKPENFDPNKKYPMLVYFYERNSDQLHRHSIPSPSRSIINWSWCTSNGYLVFIPDIVYKDGYPGQGAYDAIVSGTKTLSERYSFIDSEKIGIQGQSWGGYQVAYLVTQTNMFAAAMAGAPVSNMTSAYGGIRWGSGMSRMFQYEQTQSRIGGTLWDKTQLYIENSPIFFMPKVETPVLIMHNDADGAVPWYQGIEYFVALRRLNKPAWLLQYNNEEHNLTRWPNRVDLSIRMMGFFDYYLKDHPQPDWMENGVPAINKGILPGY